MLLRIRHAPKVCMDTMKRPSQLAGNPTRHPLRMHMGLKCSVLVQIMDMGFTYVCSKWLTIIPNKTLIYINQKTCANGWRNRYTLRNDL